MMVMFSLCQAAAVEQPIMAALAAFAARRPVPVERRTIACTYASLRTLPYQRLTSLSLDFDMRDVHWGAHLICIAPQVI
ncbi:MULTISPECIES: hypothetical protein [unclassified Mesorhizobium]|uniref:hypothetical protein n=1 Tax=unclassified Mesorhizobium TaxID=325217 RepID=UPI0003CECFC3|nr:MULTISPECIES: hypothetical protein [unclassified Mesorhizobium]ESY55546.1 hypothetical protein X745_11805 [Mesorhizobium sp. LNJC374B00]WJI79409.1 hypothetical protein NLY34_21365 [Mesorhizobium sp. C374B]WJI85944.1 hypothetical protein NLY42_23760 [Mesorhizobium sp. C372A]